MLPSAWCQQDARSSLVSDGQASVACFPAPTQGPHGHPHGHPHGVSVEVSVAKP